MKHAIDLTLSDAEQLIADVDIMIGYPAQGTKRNGSPGDGWTLTHAKPTQSSAGGNKYAVELPYERPPIPERVPPQAAARIQAAWDSSVDELPPEYDQAE